MQEYVNIEKLLREGNNISIKPKGYSMYPTLIPGRDEAIIEPVGGKRLHRGDVVLYRRGKEVGGILVLHRIWKITEAGIFLVGDNQKEIEGPLHKTQIKGVMTGMNRKGRYISTTNPIYRVASGIWLCLRPARPVISKTVALFRRKLKRNK